MKIGLQIIDFTWPGHPASIGPTLSAIARQSEQVGFDSLWMMDHFFQVMGTLTDPMPEAYTCLGFVAGQTSRIELGVMVSGVTYRHPGVLIKTVTTLDVLSGGRMWLGLGAGWHEREHAGLGIPFPSTKERFEQLEETLQIAHLMWSGEVTQFEGKQFSLRETLNSPQSLRRPHPPIVVGGHGETKTLRLVAKYADACNFFARHGDDWLKRKLEVLQAHCEAEGRAYGEISKTVIADAQLTRDPSGAISAQKAIDHAAHLKEMGFDYFHMAVPNISRPAALDPFHEIIPAIHAL